MALGMLAFLFLIGSWNLPLEAGNCFDQRKTVNASAEPCTPDPSETLGARVANLGGDLWQLTA
jgi:hypothetical protein